MNSIACVTIPIGRLCSATTAERGNDTRRRATSFGSTYDELDDIDRDREREGERERCRPISFEIECVKENNLPAEKIE